MRSVPAAARTVAHVLLRIGMAIDHRSNRRRCTWPRCLCHVVFLLLAARQCCTVTAVVAEAPRVTLLTALFLTPLRVSDASHRHGGSVCSATVLLDLLVQALAAKTDAEKARAVEEVRREAIQFSEASRRAAEELREVNAELVRARMQIEALNAQLEAGDSDDSEAVRRLKNHMRKIKEAAEDAAKAEGEARAMAKAERARSAAEQGKFRLEREELRKEAARQV